MINHSMNRGYSLSSVERAYRKGRAEVIDEISKYIINSCEDVNCREDITIDNDYDFYASELLDMLEQIKEQK